MSLKSQRKIFLFGRYSLALLLPKKWLSSYGIDRGSVLKVELDRNRGRILVDLNTAAKNKPNSQKTSKPKKSGDWEPIPQL